MKTQGNLLHNSTNYQDRNLDFYQIDEFYAVAEDSCIFQRVEKSELFNENNEFIGDFNNALIYQDDNDSDIIFNYAEDCEIKEFMRNHYLFEHLDEDLLEKYNKEYTNDSVLSIIRDIHEQGKENVLNEFIFILIDSLIKD